MSNFIPLYPYPILIIENSNLNRYLVISDIHIGFEDKINRKGVFIDPKKNVDELIEVLSNTINKTQIDNLIILGDLKSSVSVITKSEWNNVPYFIDSLSKLCNIYLVPGNHDGNIIHLVSNNVNLMSAKGMEINNILLTHGHAIPTIGNNINKIVTGHLHPILIKEGNILNGQKVWIKIILKKNQKVSKNITRENQERQIEFIIIPHFNKYLNHHMDSTIEDYSKGKSKLPLLHNLITKKQWRMEEVFVISLEGALVGSEKELNKIL
ncbi:MAG TPA: metallophosphoesterase [Candidatus Nitrosocosmicus sp.]|nr:metallophosphoesterase [Candidatus Nitrosocosmicus sp.]